MQAFELHEPKLRNSNQLTNCHCVPGPLSLDSYIATSPELNFDKYVNYID